MSALLLFALAGFLASFVDGALGMGFGPTSSSILLLSGLTPVAVSSSVNLAKVATGLAAAVSHWRFRNIDRGLVFSLALPGCAGALLGAVMLSSVDAATIRPVLAVLLSVIGVRILFRFARPNASEGASANASEASLVPDVARRGVRVAGFCGGVTNGLIGAWGPVVTPFLLHRGVAPRFAIGSANTAEIAVAAVSATSLIASLGRGGFDPALVAAMLVGGVLAAPVAAWLVRFVPARPMGIGVAALLLFTNLREVLVLGGAAKDGWPWLAYAVLACGVLVASLAPRVRRRTAAATE